MICVLAYGSAGSWLAVRDSENWSGATRWITLLLTSWFGILLVHLVDPGNQMTPVAAADETRAERPEHGAGGEQAQAGGQGTGWVNRALRGSPEPPLPYVAEPRFAAIEWKAPLYLAPEPDTDQLWVILQGGEPNRPSHIVRLRNDPGVEQTELVVELPGRLIYGLTFHPEYTQNGYVYLFTNGPTGERERTNRVTRYTVANRPDSVIDLSSELLILEWRSMGHDGGDLAFGLDGMLYITSGDGTSDSDVWNTGQDVTNLLATLIRIDVRDSTEEEPYRVPPDNPLLHLPEARPEIYAYGFRNPWRMSIDPRTGDIWVGNNGQDLWETAYLVRPGDNYGWSVFEGNHPFYLNRRRGPTPIVPPTIEHHHIESRSLTGGVVYYGERFPELEGAYIYGDYATGKIWGARHEQGKLTWQQELADTTLQIAAFRVDPEGELLIVDHGGGIHRLMPREEPETEFEFPRKLSDTGLFVDTAVPRGASGTAGLRDQLAGLDGRSACAAVPGLARGHDHPLPRFAGMGSSG
jgi:glucose/arabinose dehydrogenase